MRAKKTPRFRGSWIVAGFCTVFWILAGCGDSVSPGAAGVAASGNVLPRSTPEAQGVSSLDIQAFLDAVDRLNRNTASEVLRPEFHSIMVLRHGYVVAEGWWAPYRADLNHALFSLSKSFTSTAVGLAIAEGFFTLDDPVISFFPDQLPENISDNLAAMTVRHLLTMSVGQESEDRSSDDWARTFLAIPVDHEPGTVFRYNTSATFMLSAIVQNTTGQTLMEFLTPRFFEKLGIEGATWEMSPRGYNTGGYGLSIKTEDIARLGQFYLQQGLWNGEQILSPEWVAEATSARISSAPGSPPPEGVVSDWSQGYGYQFWRTTHGAYRGDGAFGQYSIVFPELDAVVAATGGSSDMQGMLNVIWEYLYPAFREEPLPEDPEAQDRLKAKLASLSLLPEPQNVVSSNAAERSGAIYRLEDNPLQGQEVVFTFTDKESVFSLTDEAGAHSIRCAPDEWIYGDAAAPLTPVNFLTGAFSATERVAAMCQWLDDDTFEMVWRYVETPSGFALTALFEGDRVFISQRGANGGGVGIRLEGRTGE